MRQQGAWLRRLAVLVVALPVAAVVLVIGSVTVLPAVFGWRPLVVTSASMTPTIPVGSAVVVNPAQRANLQTGDIGTFVDPASGLRITHRVIDVTTAPDGTRLLLTKGDATRNVDAPRYPQNVVGKVMYWVPYVGYVGYYANTSTARVPLVVGVLVLSTVILLRNLMRGAAATASGAAETPAVVQTPPTVTDALPTPSSPVRASEPARPQDEPPPVVAPLASSALSSPATRPAAPAVSAPAAPKPAPLSRLIDAVVMAAGIAAVGLAVAVFAPLAFDLHPVAMADKTMEPAVREGALVIAEKVLVADLKVGDVVVYAPAQERGKVLTRRVATVDQGSGGPAGVKITTKADQLPNPDPYTIDGTQSVGRVVYSVPVAGRILSASGRREGFLVLGGVIVLQMLLRAAQRARREGAAA